MHIPDRFRELPQVQYLYTRVPFGRHEGRQLHELGFAALLEVVGSAEAETNPKFYKAAMQHLQVTLKNRLGICEYRPPITPRDSARHHTTI